MRFSVTAAALAGVSVVAAQSINISSIEQAALAYLTPTCQRTLLQLVTNSSLATCLQVSKLAPLITSPSTPIIETLDSYLASTCAGQPCSNATLTSAAMNLTAGCASDLAQFGITNATVYEVMGLYPLGREIACLKTTAPVSPANASVSLNSTMYNTTNGTFCATEALTDLSAYLGANLTVNYIATVALGANGTALQKLESIPATALCSDCVFAAISLVEEEYPSIANATLPSSLLKAANMTSVSNSTMSAANMTLNSMLQGYCPANLTLSTNGTLPATIKEAAENSTFPYTVIAGNTTYTPAAGAAAAPTLNATFTTLGQTVGATVTPQPTAANPSAMKKRWFGEA